MGRQARGERVREGTGEESSRARRGRKINYWLIISWLRSAPEAYIICYNGYISRDNPRCGAISIYLLYTGVCLLSFVIVNISTVSLQTRYRAQSHYLLAAGLSFYLTFSFPTSLTRNFRIRETQETCDENCNEKFRKAFGFGPRM